MQPKGTYSREYIKPSRKGWRMINIEIMHRVNTWNYIEPGQEYTNNRNREPLVFAQDNYR